MTPYATVIVPTHSRAHTLLKAIASAQAQTVRDIEILIVGDGVEPEVRSVAQSLVTCDSRITFLDFPKAPGRGAANRDRAVRQARAERIFYMDDDDLWLRHHAAMLGAALDRSHVVDSTCASVSISGRIQCPLVNHESKIIRNALAAAQLKLTYDTHLAHRRSAYLQVGSAWGGEPIVQSFLSCFARDPSFVWTTIPAVTALSFHGAARVTSTAAARVAELESWSSRLRTLLPESLFAQAFVDWYLFRSLSRVPTEPNEDLSGYLRRLGVAIADVEDQDGHLLRYNLNPEKTSALFQTFAFDAAADVDRVGLGELAIRLTDPLVGTTPNGHAIAKKLAASVGNAAALATVRALDTQDDQTAELKGFLEACVLNLMRDRRAARRIVLGMLNGRPIYKRALHLLAAGLELAMKDFDASATHCREAIRENPAASAAYLQLAKAYLGSGNLDQALECCSAARECEPNRPDIDRMVATIVRAREEKVRL